MNTKLTRSFTGLCLASVLIAGCQNTINAPRTTGTTNLTPGGVTSTAPSAVASTVTAAVPAAVQGTSAVSSALTQAAANASGNSAATAIITSTAALVNLPSAFMNAFKTAGFHAASTSLTRTAAYGGTTYTVNYTSDDNFAPLATWTVSVTGGAFSSSTAVLTGHVSQDGTTGDWTWTATQLSQGQTFTVNWATDSSSTITVNYSVGSQATCTVAIQTSGHGTYSCSGQTGTF